MIEEILVAFGIIFFAEMGDKSQMLAMAFASKYKIKYVILGMFIGILFNHILAVFLGQFIGGLIPLEIVTIGAGILFLLFGFWSLSLEKDYEEKVFQYGPIVTVSFAFFIGELGDKTQLATFALASDASYPLLILLGTVSGMMAVGMLGIYIGMKLGSKIPEELMKVISAAVFITFGIVKLYQNLDAEYTVLPYVFLFVSLMIILFILRAIPLIDSYKHQRQTHFKQTAANLQLFYSDLYEKLDGICLGENVCGGCDGTSCLVGYTKEVLRNAKNLQEVDLNYVKDANHQKRFPKDKVLESLLLVLRKLDHDHGQADHEILTQLRYNYERLLLHTKIQQYTSKEEYIAQVEYYDKSVAKSLSLNWT